MSEYDTLIEGYELAKEDPGPLTDEEHQALMESVAPVEVDAVPPPPAAELRVLKPDQTPAIGTHYVVFEGKPWPVLRSLPQTEDEYVRAHLSVEGLSDHDGQRRVRADRSLRARFRGYLCGEIGSL